MDPRPATVNEPADELANELAKDLLNGGAAEENELSVALTSETAAETVRVPILTAAEKFLTNPLVLISPFFLWGTSMVAMKGVMAETSPLFLASVRLLPAGVWWCWPLFG